MFPAENASSPDNPEQTYRYSGLLAIFCGHSMSSLLTQLPESIGRSESPDEAFGQVSISILRTSKPTSHDRLQVKQFSQIHNADSTSKDCINHFPWVCSVCQTTTRLSAVIRLDRFSIRPIGQHYETNSIRSAVLACVLGEGRAQSSADIRKFCPARPADRCKSRLL